ncbi:MAG: DUF1643 domain-containing protein [Clostridia bacterium]|nr:DUF1643 domain-containing protein [Clostridia bacterium]
MNNNLIECTITIKSTAVISKDNKRRYLLKYEWDNSKPSAIVIMSQPSTANELITDQTTMLVRNNAVEQGFGSISIANLFCCLDFKKPETDRINSSLLLEECSKVDVVIVAYGRGTAYTEEKERLLEALKKAYPEKLHTIIDSSGQAFSHPLSPKARIWNLKKLL